jgi:hypothetical protein
MGSLARVAFLFRGLRVLALPRFGVGFVGRFRFDFVGRFFRACPTSVLLLFLDLLPPEGHKVAA